MDTIAEGGQVDKHGRVFPAEITGHGGMRPNLGRLPGGENSATRDKKEALRQYRERVLKHMLPIFNAQLALAQGVTYVYRIDETEDDKGKKTRKHVLVESPEEIAEVLDGGLGEMGSGVVGDDYYYITVKPPDSRTIDMMLNRTFGMPKQEIELGDPNGNALQFIISEVIANKNVIQINNVNPERTDTDVKAE